MRYSHWPICRRRNLPPNRPDKNLCWRRVVPTDQLFLLRFFLWACSRLTIRRPTFFVLTDMSTDKDLCRRQIGQWEQRISRSGWLPSPWLWYNIAVVPSNRKPSNLKFSIHQRRFDSKNLSTSHLQYATAIVIHSLRTKAKQFANDVQTI